MDFRDKKMPYFEFFAVPSTVFSIKPLNKCLLINSINESKKGKRQFGVFGALKEL